MPRKFTESAERPQTVVITLTFNGGNNPIGALVSSTFVTQIRNDADANDKTDQTVASISFDGLTEARSINARTFKQITNSVVDMVLSVRATPL